MNRKHFFLIVTILVVLGFCIVIYSRPQPRQSYPMVKSASEQLNHFDLTNASAVSKPKRSTVVGDSNSEGSSELDGYTQQTIQDPMYDWKQSIRFYGKVVDEANLPIPDATIDFGWNDLSETGRSTASTSSDAAGLFSLSDRVGKRLFVDVHKSGYYSSQSNPLAFEYANPADNPFKPDSNNPVVFHLRKKGKGEQLIQGTKLFGTRIDGALSYVDLMQGTNKRVPPGDLSVRCIRSERNSQKKYDWSFTLSVPEGGLVESTNEFDFIAPTEGYQPSIEIGYKADASNWASQETRKFLVKSRGGKAYSRIEVTFIPFYSGNAAYEIEWFLNPRGSKNLEPE